MRFVLHREYKGLYKIVINPKVEIDYDDDNAVGYYYYFACFCDKASFVKIVGRRCVLISVELLADRVNNNRYEIKLKDNWKYEIKAKLFSRKFMEYNSQLHEIYSAIYLNLPKGKKK